MVTSARNWREGLRDARHLSKPGPHAGPSDHRDLVDHHSTIFNEHGIRLIWSRIDTNDAGTQRCKELFVFLVLPFREREIDRLPLHVRELAFGDRWANRTSERDEHHEEPIVIACPRRTHSRVPRTGPPSRLP